MPDGGGIALVTGASGFVGSHLVERLVEAGVVVRCLLRESSDPRYLPPSDLVDLHRVSLDNAAGLERALEGVNAIYHLGAVTSAVDHAEYFRANTEGTRKLVEAARRVVPDSAFVLCSTLAAAGPSQAGKPVTERDEPSPIGPYGRSKLDAERIVRESGLRTAVIRAPAVYGPRDRDILEMFRWAVRGFSPVVGRHEQRLSMVHVSDLVTALESASRAPSGGTYFVTDGRVHTRSELVEHISRAVNRQARRVHIPVALAMALAHASRIAARVAGTKPLLTPERIRDFCELEWTCDDSLARTELGYSHRIEIEEGLHSTALWYRQQRWI